MSSATLYFNKLTDVYHILSGATLYLNKLPDVYHIMSDETLYLNKLPDVYHISSGATLYLNKLPDVYRIIRGLDDLVNFVVGLPGHIIERASWVVHDAFTSLVDGFMSSRFKLRSPAAGSMFKPRPSPDDIFDDLGLGLGDLGMGDANDDIFGGIAAPTGPLPNMDGRDPLDLMFW
ncbi:hypothetical protein ElyMa_001421000 [Elysia marginata]|uniref:Uncharacterized protein n=1 Tax=Elysia marginata TaxID=1093978 RepID=A0AAV4IUW1_9GAST|nr:hypothetical protein ElyMa_001421000 [Elysia marginata]